MSKLSLVFVKNNRVVTDSLMVAEAFEKEHKNVLKDIRELGCSKEFGQLNFEQSSYLNSQNKSMPKYLITQDGFTLLAMGYSGKKAMEFKEKYIAEFNRMKEQIPAPSVASYMIEDPIERAKQWIEEQKKVQLLEQRAALYEEKANYVDEILKSKNTVTTTQIAKDYGMSARTLNQILKEEGIQFKQRGQWLLKSTYHDKGYTKSYTVDIERSDGTPDVKMNTHWTQKGRLFIHRVLEKRGIVAMMDQELMSG
ncbi:Rha family transcriptional regulator [Halalkalibacter sp. AB-rgal2]|uniref:Rha family transcriptional regulator n=1 Tax=Halalkalibacter sp. AB-rgal2 TaxID=3242695 RepID=UPI00359EEF16